MKSGEPRKTKMNHSAGLHSRGECAALAIASAVARKNPDKSASVPKYMFQIIPDPISVTCWQMVKSARGNRRSPMPTLRSA